MGVVVTGAAGLVGRAVARALRRRADTAVGLIRDARRAAHRVNLGHAVGGRAVA